MRRSCPEIPLKLAFLLLLLADAGCTHAPAAYPPPAQREALSGQDPSSLRSYVRMNESGADAHLVKDVSSFIEGSGYRWTGQNPTLQFLPVAGSGQHLTLDFTLSSEVLKNTGPITLSISIDGKPFDRVTYHADGEQRYAKPVPDGWLVAGRPVTVSVALDKTWHAPDGGTRGLILTEAGFTE